MATNKLKECKIALQMIFFCNPFSMLIFTFFAPARAATFAHRREFTPLMAEIYGLLSYWLPWHWKKHWMAYEVLADYSVEDQCRYFMECSKTPETLGKMSEPARDALWKVATEYPNCTNQIWKKCRKHLDSKKVIDAFVENVGRLKDEQVKYLLETKDLPAFKTYLKHGAIRYEQVKMLAHAAVYAHPTLPLYTPQVGDGGFQSGTAAPYTKAEVRAIERSYQADCQIFLEILIDYVKKHGVKADLLSYIDSLEAKEAGDNVKQALNAALKVHEQCVFVSAESDNEYSDAWRIFCEKTPEICIEAQKRMNLKQYDVYHRTGHILQAEAIASFIRKGNIDMCRKIFVNEPENGFINEEIAHLIHANREVQTLFYQILQELEKKK